MTGRLREFTKRYSSMANRFELLDLEKDIKEYISSEDFRHLSEETRNALDDLLLEVMNKKEYFQKGCDPWKGILGN
jgi:hypothetical protein